MIIDAHAHLGERGFLHETWWQGLRTYTKEYALSQGVSAENAEKVADDFIAALADPSGEKLIQTMDNAGIDKTVIMPLDWGLVFGEPPIPIEEQNRQHCKLAQKFPDRLIAFASVDPHRRGGLRLFERAVKEWGAKGLKVHSLSGFYLNDPALYPFYEKAQELGLPAIVHLGTDPPPLRSRYGQPIYLNDVAIDFPELQIIGAHMGGIWEAEAVALAQLHPNVHLDLALKQGHAFASHHWGRPRHRAGQAYVTHLEFYQWLRHVLNQVGPKKLLLGSDYPYVVSRDDQTRWVKVFSQIPESVREAGIQFTKEEIEGILGNNAARVLGLE